VRQSKPAYHHCHLARYDLCFITVSLNYVRDDHAAAVEKTSLTINVHCTIITFQTAMVTFDSESTRGDPEYV